MSILYRSLLAALCMSAVALGSDAKLPGTGVLEWSEEELPDRLMDGAHRFVERKIADAAKTRKQFWPKHDDTADSHAAQLQANREELRTIIGAVDERLQPAIEFFGNTSEQVVVYRGESFRVAQVRWPVLEGVWGEGLLVTPNEKAIAAAIVIPDADQTPEQLLGLTDGIPDESQIARRLIANKVEVLIPTLVTRQKLETEDA